MEWIYLSQFLIRKEQVFPTFFDERVLVKHGVLGNCAVSSGLRDLSEVSFASALTECFLLSTSSDLADTTKLSNKHPTVCMKKKVLYLGGRGRVCPVRHTSRY